MTRARIRRAGALAALSLALTSCGLVPAATHSTPAPGGGYVVTGPGWTQSGGIENLPKGPCHVRTSAEGHDLPDPACTPGAADDRVQPDRQSLANTICRKGGYTGSVRPPDSVTGPAKRAIMRAYGLDPATADQYELDHLIELSDGGSSDGRNLWPEKNVLRDAKADPYTKNDKDAVERMVHDAVCSGREPLRTAQQAMSSDWTTAKEGTK